MSLLCGNEFAVFGRRADRCPDRRADARVPHIWRAQQKEKKERDRDKSKGQGEHENQKKKDCFQEGMERERLPGEPMEAGATSVSLDALLVRLTHEQRVDVGASRAST